MLKQIQTELEIFGPKVDPFVGENDWHFIKF
jgi:hypothetical protein